MSTLKSKFIMGAKPNPDTLTELMKLQGVKDASEIMFYVFEVELDGKVVYACCSGGRLTPAGPELTLVGQAAIEALANLPMGSNRALIVQEVKLGPTPIADKLRMTVEAAPAGAKICFLGDLAGELDGKMGPALSIQPELVRISH